MTKTSKKSGKSVTGKNVRKLESSLLADNEINFVMPRKLTGIPDNTRIPIRRSVWDTEHEIKIPTSVAKV